MVDGTSLLVLEKTYCRNNSISMQHRACSYAFSGDSSTRFGVLGSLITELRSPVCSEDGTSLMAASWAGVYSTKRFTHARDACASAAGPCAGGGAACAASRRKLVVLPDKHFV